MKTLNPQTGETTTPKAKGRNRVGGHCFQCPDCKNALQCQNVYCEELWRNDGTCKEFHPKHIPEEYTEAIKIG